MVTDFFIPPPKSYTPPKSKTQNRSVFIASDSIYSRSCFLSSIFNFQVRFSIKPGLGISLYTVAVDNQAMHAGRSSYQSNVAKIHKSNATADNIEKKTLYSIFLMLSTFFWWFQFFPYIIVSRTLINFLLNKQTLNAAARKVIYINTSEAKSQLLVTSK